jgi:hypothetical protein
MRIVNKARVAALSALIALPITAGSVVAQGTPRHHSKIKGAIVGAAVGHAMGHHGKVGAVAGVMVQHHRNKKARRATG